MKIIVAMLTLICLPLVASAHHSRAEFSSDVKELEGELLTVDWSNPHPAFSLRVVDGGATETWQIQGYGSIYTLSRAGVTGEYFRPGDRVRLAGTVSTRREKLFLVMNLLLPDGREVVFRRDAVPFWAEAAVGGEENFVATQARLVDTTAENRGIFRLWSRPFGGSQSVNRPPMTEEAAAAVASWDALSDTSMAVYRRGCQWP